jgi:hypothetical protein
MRHDSFGNAYCYTADEARRLIEAHGRPVYVPEPCITPERPLPGWAENAATAEIADNSDADLVCYIEAATVEAVHEIIAELDLEII